jgi:DNA-binding transcriptional LysR family regulator
MTSERLLEFVVLAGMLNYSKAASKLFMTQSTLSRHIKELEKELGTDVFKRSTHKVVLTEAGKALLQAAPGLLQKCDDAIARLRIPGMEAEGSVNIACTDSCACNLLFNFLKLFQLKYNDVDMRVHLVSGDEQVHTLGQYDFVFMTFERQKLSGSVHSKLLFSLPAYVALMPEHRLFCSHQIGLKDLMGETLFVPHADEMFCSYAVNRQLVERHTGGKVNIVKVPNVQTALMMVALGAGVTIIPQDMSERTMNGTKVIGISTRGCRFDTYLYWNKNQINPAAKLFLEEIEHFIEMKNKET